MELILDKKICDFVGYDRGTKIHSVEFVPTGRGLGYAYMVDVADRNYALANPNRATKPTKYNEHLMSLEEFKTIFKNRHTFNQALRGCTSFGNFEKALANKSKKYRQ